MIDAEAVQELKRSEQKPQVVQADGLERVYLPAGEGWVMDALPYRARLAEPLRVCTLDALAAYAGDWREDGACVHVASHSEARLCGALSEGRRQVYAVATSEPAYGDGRWRPDAFVPLEEAVIALQTRFVEDAERNGLMSLLGRIRDENIREDADDGITQRVTVRAGAALASEVAVKNPWTLRPYRTFREVAQPASAFIVRLRAGKSGEGPTVALFEADGGKWKIDAIVTVADWLRGHSLTMPVFA